MAIPPDFHIEYSIINMHLWLLISRLDDFDTREARFFKKVLLNSFKVETNEMVVHIHLKKKNDFIKDILGFMNLNRNTFDRHFKLNYNT